MKKISRLFKKIASYIRGGINILVRFILAIVYFLLLLPFAVAIKLFTDFLGFKEAPPNWIPHGKIENVKDFLTRQ